MNQPILPLFDSFEEYEASKLNHAVFEVAAQEIIKKHHLPADALSPLEGTNTVFAYGKNRIIKIYPPFHQDQFKSDLLVMKQLENKVSVKTPTIEHHGVMDHWPYIIMDRLEGVTLEGLWEQLDHHNKKILIQELGRLIKEVHALPTTGLESIACDWPHFMDTQIKACFATHEATKLPAILLHDLPTYLESAKTRLPPFIKPVILRITKHSTEREYDFEK